jgi:hypothetical protein
VNAYSVEIRLPCLGRLGLMELAQALMEAVVRLASCVWCRPLIITAGGAAFASTLLKPAFTEARSPKTCGRLAIVSKAHLPSTVLAWCATQKSGDLQVRGYRKDGPGLATRTRGQR